MALSGNFETKFSGGSSGGYYIGVDWKVNSQSASSNSSNVTATVYLRTSGNGYSISSSATKDVSVTINGSKYLSTCTAGIGVKSKKNLFSKTVNVSHDSNGNKTCSFACALDINVTLGGTYCGKVSSSGSGTFNQIILNQPPTLSGSVTISPSGTIGENTTTLNIDWNDAKDPNGDTVEYRVYRYINGTQNGVYWQGSSSLSDNISSFGQGTTFQYKVWAYDPKGTYSGEISSAIVTKNKFTGAWFTGHSNDIVESTTQFSLTVGGASNTNGNTTFKYRFYSDDVTVYNQRDVTTTTETITIWKDHLGESEPTGKPYIKFSDLKNKYRGTNFNGRLHVGVRTLNAYGSQVWNDGSVGVDLRATPSAPSSVTINGGSAYKTVASASRNSYYIPNGTDTIAIQWSGGEDKIKETHQYRIYQIVDGTAKEVAIVSGTTKSYNLVLPKISATKTLAIRVQTVTSYGYTSYKDSTAITLHYYNPPSVDVQKVDRTDTSAKATLTLKANTSIPNVTFATRSYSGVSSGTLTNTTSSQTISASGLKGNSKYSWTITLKDDTGFSESVTRSIEVPSYTPLFSVREKGVGIGVIPNGTYNFEVKGKANIDGTLTVNGKPIQMDTSNLVKKTDLATNNKVYGKIPQIGADGVIEVGKYIDFHDGDNGQDYSARITCSGTELSMNGALAIGGNITCGGVLTMRNYIALKDFGGSWLNGATNGAIRGSKQSTGSYHPIISQTTASNHKISMGGINNNFGFYLYDANRTENGVDRKFDFDLATKQVETNMRFIVNSEWLYTTGNTGWYNSTHGGGWFMSDSTWLRSYNDKNIYTGGTIKANNALETRYINSIGGNLDINSRGNTLFINVNADSGANLNINRVWSGTQGTEISIYNSKGKGWGFIGNTNNTFYRIYGAGGSVSARDSKYHITKADDEQSYEYVKQINAYNFRTISTTDANIDEVAKNYINIKEFREDGGSLIRKSFEYEGVVYDEIDNNLEEEEVESLRIQEVIDKNPQFKKDLYRQDLMLGAMVDELPTEVVFYDNEDGDGKAVDMYSYTTMIVSALKHTIKKVEKLEEILNSEER